MKACFLIHLAASLALQAAVEAGIPKPDDAPKPLTTTEAARSFHLPPGYAIKLLASEPLIHEPSGVCWDEHGRMFVCELHGYNVEGQYDIDELNQTGKLDLEVRRIQASEQAKQRAKKDNYGTVKLLLDTDGDGVMDKAEVWADHLPLCYGIVPARQGVIVACPPDIVYLHEQQGNDPKIVRESLFTGFGVGQPERGVNAPTWGVDNWIYFGRGHSGGTITGPHLKEPVVIGNTDFRIRADGSAIEPITGSTKTIGMTFTEGGDRFVTTTTSPGLFVTPISAHYFARNPDAAAPLADAPAADYNQTFPLAPPHPWRVKREQHAEYFAFYKKISLSDAAASGYFTSACSPLVYQDALMPELRGQYLVCEPAQNLVHHALIDRDGTRLVLGRMPLDKKGEFLASTDPWFHPINLQATPDGSVAVVDFYREIIEDYSAIPRHLQQQYGVINGHDRGRIWILTKDGHKPKLDVDMSALDEVALVRELGSDLLWRRQTARRLLIERKATRVANLIAALMSRSETATVLGALYTLEGLAALESGSLLNAWHHASPDVRKHALLVADRDFTGVGHAVEQSLLTTEFAGERAPQLLLQAALSLGESHEAPTVRALVKLAREHGDLRWMDAAIASSAFHHEKEILAQLISDTGNSQPVITNLAGVVAARGDPKEIEATIALFAPTNFGALAKPLEILRMGLEETKPSNTTTAMPSPLAAQTKEQIEKIEKRMPEYVSALKDKTNAAEGRVLFQSICAACHRSQGVGVAVGPDLDAEFQRAPEVILRDILFPSENIRPGFETVLAKTQRGEELAGIAVSDSPTSITLRLAGGVERVVLRKRANISIVRNVSLMPFGLGDALKPAQIANIVAYLRLPTKK